MLRKRLAALFTSVFITYGNPAVSAPKDVDSTEPSKPTADYLSETPKSALNLNPIPKKRGDYDSNYHISPCFISLKHSFSASHSRNQQTVYYPGAYKILRGYSDIKTAQKHLQTLGFDIGSTAPDGIIGAKTRAAITEFQTLYGPIENTLKPTGRLDRLTFEHMAYYAEHAIKDAKRYYVSAMVMGSIRLAQMRTGADFEFMVELARQESSFRSYVSAPVGTANGLYQFIESTWLKIVYNRGCDYGLEQYARDITFDLEDLTPREIRNDKTPEIEPDMANAKQKAALLAMRKNPRYSAIFAAENNRRESNMVAKFLDRPVTKPVEKYIVHFLGVEGAYFFLKHYDETPDARASDFFKREARSNPAVFKNRNYRQVYAYLDRKFNTGLYREYTAFKPYVPAREFSVSYKHNDRPLKGS